MKLKKIIYNIAMQNGYNPKIIANMANKINQKMVNNAFIKNTKNSKYIEYINFTHIVLH